MRQNVPEFHSLLTALTNEKVRFVVVGGLALVFYGATTVTFDVDFAVATDSENVDAILRALAPFHPFPPQVGTPESFVWDRRSFLGAVLELVTDAGHVDLLLIQPGVESFEALWSRAELRQLGEMEISVACIDDLIAMKRAAHRPKDLDHIRQLEAIKNLRERGS